MQRLRAMRGDTRLSISDETDVFSFDQGDDSLYISLRESVVSPAGRKVLRVLGKDNMRDFGNWFARRPVNGSNGTFLTDDISDNYCRFAVVSQERPTLEPYLSEVLDLAALAITKLEDIVGPDPEKIKPSTTPEILAVEHRIIVPLGHVTTLFAAQEASELTLTFDETRDGHTLPLEPAQKFGEWVLENLDVIPKKSIWG